jgi:hypothetical protein
VIGAVTAGATAQTEGADSANSLDAMADAARVRIQATAGMWYPALSGESRFGTAATGGDLRVDTLLGLEDNEPTFAGNLTLFVDERWLVLLDTFDFSTDASLTSTGSILVNGMAFASGTSMTGDFGITSFAAMAGYDFFGNLHERLSGPSEGGLPVDIRIHVLGGARGINIDHQLALSGGPTVEYDEWGATLNGGGRISIGIGPEFASQGRWDVGISLTYGLGGSSDGDLTTFDIDFGIRYTVLDHFGLVLGYRQIDIDLDAEDASQPYRWDGRLAGLFFGGELKF